MQCYYCGHRIPSEAEVCPVCGHARTKLSYVHMLAVIGGVVGSLIGFTLFDMPGALVGGLASILASELGGRLAFRR